MIRRAVDDDLADAPAPMLLAGFVRSVGVLAMPAEGQLAWLDSLGSVASWNVDELALEFDAGHRLSPQWAAAGWLDVAALPALDALDSALDAMSGEEHADLWSEEALERASEWAAVRELAAAVLRQL